MRMTTRKTCSENRSQPALNQNAKPRSPKNPRERREAAVEETDLAGATEAREEEEGTGEAEETEARGAGEETAEAG